MTEYRIVVKAGEPQDFVTDDGGTCISIRETDWVYFHSSQEVIRQVMAEIVDRLPEVLPHLSVQVRDVTPWSAA